MIPAYDGMPSTDRTFTVDPWGEIRCGGTCRDDYDRLRVYDQPPAGGAPIILQAAALRSFKRCEELYARRRWHPGYPKVVQVGKKPNDRVLRPIILTGSLRGCDVQRRLYASDRSRYASPDVTGHTRGLCIDVSTYFLNDTIRALLLAHGWHQARPPGSRSPEPWHFSFGIRV